MVAPAGIEPATQGFSVPCSTDWAMKPNGRLSYEAKWRSQRDSNPRSSAWQADVLTSCTMRPIGCGRRIWTYDLRVMSPASYRTAPSRDIITLKLMAEEKGFEPLRRSHDLPVFKTGPFNQTWVFLHRRHFRRQNDYNTTKLIVSTLNLILI